MKFTMQTKPFSAALKAVLPIVCKRVVKPALTHVRLDVGHVCALTATDLERTATVDVEGMVADSFQGAILLPAARLAQLLSTIREETITVDTDGKSCEITGQRCRHKLPLYDVTEFPKPPGTAQGQVYGVPAEALRLAIKRTCIATDDESATYAIGGVLFDFARGLHLVGTDGRALAAHRASGTVGEAMAGVKPIVPAASLTALANMLPSGGNITITAMANDVQFAGDGFTFTARTLEGRFPKWRNVIPEPVEYSTADAPAGELLSLVRQAAFANGQERKEGYLLHPGVDLRLAAGELLASAETENGASEARLPVAYDGQPISVTLGSEYLIAFLRAVEPEAFVQLLVKNAELAVVLCEGDTEFVVMPLVKN